MIFCGDLVNYGKFILLERQSETGGKEDNNSRDVDCW